MCLDACVRTCRGVLAHVVLASVPRVYACEDVFSQPPYVDANGYARGCASMRARVYTYMSRMCCEEGVRV